MSREQRIKNHIAAEEAKKAMLRRGVKKVEGDAYGVRFQPIEQRAEDLVKKAKTESAFRNGIELPGAEH